MARTDGIILDGDAVEQARHKRLMTVGELVKRSRTSGRFAWRARTGQRVSIRKARDLARALRVPLWMLVADSAGETAEAGRGDLAGEATDAFAEGQTESAGDGTHDEAA